MTPAPLARELVAELTARGERVAVAESLTGGLLVSALVDAPGASAVVTGAVVAYATELKASLLGVDAAVLAERGAVDEEVARQLARGARERLGIDGEPVDYGVATTGVAGPDPQDGQPPGVVWIAVATAEGTVAERLALPGDRAEVRAGAVVGALALLARVVGGDRRGLRE